MATPPKLLISPKIIIPNSCENSYFGVTLLMLLSSCLLHLTVTAYFLILSLLSADELVIEMNLKISKEPCEN